ncbi:SDR family oxidoreductase [Siccirubricoccus sp. KC 17139]|uniref:SDR family oxidoreductase n=1 Tax=Siccirubricoccus soli TaxID=2899147 RepID=A0ABT1DAS3_9PROT|nr:SDR family NAD(P)-dependent oxidoreductase [Siccirubricoccus soli]MCO6419026.1 SDR family oxidoreductase [Siccirubricoccus soli]MCP2685161.1 SDR family oxidoreductase [Siccirubricoccus soli]
MQNPMELTGRTIIVTGAGQGIGKAITELVLGLGGNAVLVERNPETLAATAAAMDPERILAVQGNVAEEGFGESCVAQAVSRFGAVHGLVNNAGITRPAMFAKMTMQQWQAVIDVNLTGCYLMMQAVGRHMIERAKENMPQPIGTTGAVVNIASTAGKRGSIGQVNYSAAKAGLFGMTMTGAREWARYGIRCNSVGFGTVVTPMTETIRSEKFAAQTMARIPLGRYAEPHEVAPLICFLLSNGAVYITGENMTVSGGSHMQP